METVKIKIEPLALMLMFANQIEESAMTDVFKRRSCNQLYVTMEAFNRWKLSADNLKIMCDHGINIELEKRINCDETSVNVLIPYENYYPSKKEIELSKELFDFVMKEFLAQAFDYSFKCFRASVVEESAIYTIKFDISKEELGSLYLCSNFIQFVTRNEFDFEIKATDVWILSLSFPKDRF